MIARIADASALGVQWLKSTYSGADSNCVETGRLDGATAVRDSKNTTGPALRFGNQAWRHFIADTKASV